MAFVADIGLRCTRRKQANPRRKNFECELEVKMPEDTQLIEELSEKLKEEVTTKIKEEVTEKADPKPESESVQKSKESTPTNDQTTPSPNSLHSRCPHCGRVFRGQKSELSLQEHITSIHAVINPNRSSKSNMVSSPSSTRSSDTIIDQTSDNPFVCSKCKASFAQKEHLDKHELLHSTQGQYCHQCNKSFANVYRLQRHMLSHDQSQVLRKFKCPECFKAFKFKHHLKEHIRIHSGEKPFACPNCGKRFSHSGSYSSHMTSKKCLVVNLKVRKVDQIRNQRNRNTNGVNTNGLKKRDLLVNSTESTSNQKMYLNGNRINKRDEYFDISSERNLSVLKTELNDKFAPVFLTSEISRCGPENSSFHNFVPNNYSPGLSCLHPALFSAAAASVGLPTHYLSSTLSSYPEVANAILRSQMDKSVKEIGLNRNNCLTDNNKLNSMKVLENNTVLENYDLTSMKKILQIVDSKVTKSHLDSINNVSDGDIHSSNPSPLTLSVTSLPLPQIAPIDSPEDRSVLSSQNSCRFCNDYFENKMDLYQHESHVCKHRISKSSDRNSNESYNKSSNNSNAINSSAAESDDESQRDSSLEEEVMNSDGKKVRVRSVLGEETLRILRAQYDINPRPKKHDILRLAQEVNYSPRVVQVWFQNMRARDRRLGRPITSISSGLSPHSQPIVSAFSPLDTHPSTHSIPTSLMPISIPHYKPLSNLCLSENMALNSNITSVGSDLNRNEFTPNSDLKSIPKTFNNRSEKLCSTDQPLDLSLRKRSLIEDSIERTLESEDKSNSSQVLNLSQKSSRIQTNETSDEDIPNNVSLALIQQQQRKELEQTSIVRSMLMNTCPSNGFNSPISHMNVLNAVNGTDLQSPERLTRFSPPIKDVLNESGGQLPKRNHSDSDDIGHQSDSNNPSDDYLATRTKSSMSLPSKLCKTINDNVIISDDQSPPSDHNSQIEGTGLFTCDQCDKTFSKQSSLARHKYEHSGQRPHKCDVCSKAFKHKHHLTEHKRLHSGEKPFQCKKCLKRFSHSGSYSQHMNHRYSYCKPYRD